MNAIHPVIDPKGRDTTIVYGDEITKVYYPDQKEGRSSEGQLQDDFFTAEFKVDTDGISTEEEMYERMGEATKDKKVYVRCYVKTKRKPRLDENGDIVVGDDGKKVFDEVPGENTQFINIKPAKLITADNSAPLVPF